MDERTKSKLVKLQEIDTAIDKEAAERERSPVLAALRKAEEAYRRLEETKARLREELSALDRLRSDLEMEVGGLEAKLGELRQQLFGGAVKGPRELLALEHESEVVERKKDEAESKLLEVMLAADETSSKLAQLDSESEEAGQQLAEAKQRWKEEEALFDTRVSALRSERTRVASELDLAVLEDYERLRRYLGGTAVARLLGKRCTGCNVDVSKANLEEVRSARDSLARCENCGRILVAGDGP